MFRTNSQNRKLFLSLLLATYILSAFQQPVHEFLHYLSHINDIAHSDYVKHNHRYLHQNEIDHDHLLLSLLENSTNDEQAPFSSVETLKKKVEISTPSLFVMEHRRDKFDNFIHNFLYRQVYKECIFPPPKLV